LLRKAGGVAFGLMLGALLGTQAAIAQGNCTAAAGTLRGYKPTDCLQPGGTIIGAISNGGQVVPPGYQVRWVLTKGTDLIIQAVGNVQHFTVTSTGFYTIHRLVYNPATLDLGVVELGVTPAAAVNGLLIQGGGTICAALDLVGTSVNVDNPDAGTLTALNAAPCLEDGVVNLDAVVATAPYVPEGYSVVYVLTEGPGLTIINAGSEPSFQVDAPGSYTIHTLVYDPATLNLSVVQLGTTTGFDVNGLLLQGGGLICAALDVPGAAFNVEVCEEPCLANAGTLTGSEYGCLGADGLLIGATPNGDSIVPAGYSVLYVLTSGAELTIQNVNTEPSFTVSAEGLYTIHTLVYDPATLDLSIVELGVTTGIDVLNAVIANNICASLDVDGVKFKIADCGNNGQFSVAAWPTAANEELYIRVQHNATRAELSVFNLHGEMILPARSLGAGETVTRLDLNGLPVGSYMVRVMSSNRVVSQRFMRVD